MWMYVPGVLLMLCGWLQVDSMAASPAPMPVYRCTQGGDVRWQDRPCAPDERMLRWRSPAGSRQPPSAPPSYVMPPATPAPPPLRARSARRPRRDAVPLGAVITLQQDPAACSRMRRLREDAMRKRRRPAGYLLERAWEDRVRDACR